jgi:hypothetical protein
VKHPKCRGRRVSGSFQRARLRRAWIGKRNFLMGLGM